MRQASDASFPSVPLATAHLLLYVPIVKLAENLSQPYVPPFPALSSSVYFQLASSCAAACLPVHGKERAYVSGRYGGQLCMTLFQFRHERYHSNV